MAEHPDAVELLALARETLLAQLADAVPAEKRYTLLMVANAMAIAAREVQAGERLPREALADLCTLYGETAGAAEDATAHRMRLERRLAADIRRGAFDGEAGERLRALLLGHVRTRLAVSNPKVLRDEEPPQPAPGQDGIGRTSGSCRRGTASDVHRCWRYARDRTRHLEIDAVV